MYEIPEDICRIEFDGDKSIFQGFENIITESRSKENVYIKLQTAMIHLEEASNSKRVRKFNLRNVQLVHHSHENHIFSIEYNVCLVHSICL